MRLRRRHRPGRRFHGFRLAPLLFATALAALAWQVPRQASAAADACPAVGSWLEPGSGAEIAWPELIEQMAGKQVVLLGESHPEAEHHRWQLQVLSALQARRPDLAVGFEMLPRATQQALARWQSGELDVVGFLDAVDWQTSWGYDPALYLPLFHFVRMHRLPAVALNVDRGLIRQVSADGWDAVPEAMREGVGDPAAASDAYRRALAEVFAEKRRQGVVRKSDDDDAQPAAEGTASTEAEDAEALIQEILASPRFDRFVQAQLTWDRAMAEGLAAAQGSPGNPLAVGILGSGHARFGYGVPHQLADLGLEQVAVLLPVSRDEACEGLPADVADAVFVVEPPAAAAPLPKPRLGIIIEAAENGVRVMQVLPDSVADVAGLMTGDVISTAAGFAIARSADLIEIVTRQAPGTWLPLTVLRDGEASEMVARFPQSFGPPQ